MEIIRLLETWTLCNDLRSFGISTTVEAVTCMIVAFKKATIAVSSSCLMDRSRVQIAIIGYTSYKSTLILIADT
jgi:hypothetical protein